MFKINKKLFMLIIGFVLLFTLTSFIINAVKGNPTEPISKVIMESSDYGIPGSYHIDKSAKWLDSNKALISFDVDTKPITDGRYKDVVFVIDMSGSMVDERLRVLRENSKELVDVLLDDDNNNVALITFDTNSEILSGFTKDKDLIINEIDELSYRGATNYNAALKSVIEVLNGYEEKDNTDLIVLFLTDGYPNEDTPNQIGTYNILKNLYPYSNVYGIQYEIYNSIVDELKDISDKQWNANVKNLHNVLFDAVLSPLEYEKFEVVDYIDNDYFLANSDIEVSTGSVTIENENGNQKVIWNIDDFVTGNDASMKINVQLKDEYVNVFGLYPTNDLTKINYKILNKNEVIEESDKTPVLKNNYDVVYDTNTPSGCNLEDIEKETHLIFSNVTKKQDKLSCDGYLFKGWKIEDDDVVRVNDDVFIMPEHDVSIKAIWGKVDISKSMSGKIYEKTTLYKAVENEYIYGTEVKLYTGESNNLGDKNIYYYSSDTKTDINKNNVKFADFCWKIVRTTDTGGVKLLYNGRPDESGKCDSGRISYEEFGKYDLKSLNSEYNYSSNFTFDNDTKQYTLSSDATSYTWNDDNYEELLGKYTCLNKTNTCSTLYYIDKYYTNKSAYAYEIGNSKYQRVGYSPFSYSKERVAPVGYMYNTIYNSMYKNFSKMLYPLSKSSLNTEYFYGDSYIYEDDKYKLINPSRIESTDNYPNMAGKYIISSSSSSESQLDVEYVVAVDGNYMYNVRINNDKSEEYYNTELFFSDQIEKNNDGTYILTGNITKFKLLDLYNHYNDFLNKYTCFSDSNTCSEPYYIYDVYKQYFYYFSINNNFKYGNSFEYDEENHLYKLKDTIQFFKLNEEYNKLGTHHYTCLNESGECQEIAYITVAYNNSIYYYKLSDGKSISDALDEMLKTNKYDSNVKNIVDIWYSKNMTQYTDYLEDTIFCNERSIGNLGKFDPNGGNFNNLKFASVQGLKCRNKIDSFTVSDEIGNGNLTYPVGLLSVNERMQNLGIYDGGNLSSYFVLTPEDDYKIYSCDDTSCTSWNLTYNNDIRPAVSLKPNTEYTEGDGTVLKPFYIPTD